MKAKKIPVFNIQQHCIDKDVKNFKVASFGELICTANEFEEAHRHEFYEIIWLKSGSGIHQIDMIDHSYSGSVLFFLSPGQMHKIEQHKKSQGYLLKFVPAVFKHENDFMDYIIDTCLFDSVKSCPVIQIPAQINDVLEELFYRFSEEFNQPRPDSDIILSSYLKILTTHIKRIKNTYLPKADTVNDLQYTLFRKFLIEVEHHYKDRHSVQDYAKLLNTQARTLNTAARKYSDKSALEMIQDRIILEARRRLYHNDQTVKELCYHLGFEDPAYFTRFFKKHTGIAPQHFKTAGTGIKKTVA